MRGKESKFFWLVIVLLAGSINWNIISLEIQPVAQQHILLNLINHNEYVRMKLSTHDSDVLTVIASVSIPLLLYPSSGNKWFVFVFFIQQIFHRSIYRVFGWIIGQVLGTHLKRNHMDEIEKQIKSRVFWNKFRHVKDRVVEQFFLLSNLFLQKSKSSLYEHLYY